MKSPAPSAVSMDDRDTVLPPLSADPGPPAPAPVPVGNQNLQQLIQLRWVAVIGQIATILVVHFGMGIALPLLPMSLVIVTLVMINGMSLLRLRTLRQEVSNEELFVALLVDVSSLTLQLYFSGGALNPFSFLYLLQVTLGAMLLRSRTTWALAGITTACFLGLTVFFLPLEMPHDVGNGLASPYVQGLLLCFVLNVALLVASIIRISRNLRRRDARLADMRQRAAEEEHIVRMGLLASGAAHELGTPLATLSVILGDWRRMVPFNTDAELRQDLDEMQAQVARCKSIVTGILLSAGETRGEAPEATTLKTFLDGLVNAWLEGRRTAHFRYHYEVAEDIAIVSDSALKQMMFNVLDNAADASPAVIRLNVRCEDDDLLVSVNDDGPGFAPQMLAQFGKPYQSTKGRPGGGLGLFLSLNVARTLGGTISARNKPEGGAIVTVRLPLSTLRLPEEPEE